MCDSICPTREGGLLMHCIIDDNRISNKANGEVFKVCLYSFEYDCCKSYLDYLDEPSPANYVPSFTRRGPATDGIFCID